MAMSNAFDSDFASPSDWALLYRRLGMQVVPAASPREATRDGQWKRPIIQWRALLNAIVPDFTFERWYGANGEHVRRTNMGLITGNASRNLFVLDLDTHKNSLAAAWWQSALVEYNLSQEPETWAQRTGGGGRQLLFRAPAEFEIPTCRTAIGVDIRGQGGFAMLPPSRHESGRDYVWEAGREPWNCEVAAAPQWLLEAITGLAEEHGWRGTTNGKARTESPADDFDGFGARVDGREDYMVRLVWAHVVELWRQAPIPLSERASQEHMREAYAVYERAVKPRVAEAGVAKSVLLDREGRGPSAFSEKWRKAVSKWDTAVAEAGRQPRLVDEGATAEKPSAGAVGNGKGKAEEQPADAYPWLDIPAIKALPDAQWLVKDLIPDEGLGFVYGAPGSGKTFVCLDLALRLAYGHSSWWWGHQIKRTGLVLYLAREGAAGLKSRITAWQITHSITSDAANFALVRSTINFMAADDVAKVLRTIDAAAKSFQALPTVIFVDTVSRVLPGADENLQKEMTLFVAACDAIRERFGATVIGVHHASRNGNMRGSTVLSGAGDFVIKIEKPEGEEDGYWFEVEKEKEAPDGWRKQLVLERVEWTEEGQVDGARSSLVAKPKGEDQKAEETGRWPDKNKCRQVLAALNEAWLSGSPWSLAKQTRPEGRFGPRVIWLRFKIAAEVANEMLETWLAHGVIAEDMVDTHSKKRGFRVKDGLD